MPVLWPSIRSIARWVLPVLVGPSTAVIFPQICIFSPRGQRWGVGHRNASFSLVLDQCLVGSHIDPWDSCFSKALESETALVEGTNT